MIAAHPHETRFKIDLWMASRQEEPFCNHVGVKMWERRGLYGAGYQLVLLRTSSAEALLPLAPHILRAFRDITEESPPQPARPQALLFATSTLEQQGSAGVPGHWLTFGVGCARPTRVCLSGVPATAASSRPWGSSWDTAVKKAGAGRVAAGKCGAPPLSSLCPRK